MIKYHGPSFDIEGLKDFFSVDSEQKTEKDLDNDDSCEVSSLISHDIFHVTQ
jgi:hypothetical protein